MTKARSQTADRGGRLADSLVASGAISREDLKAFLDRVPTEPLDIAATGIDETDLLNLLMKLIYTAHLKTPREFVDAIKLPYPIVHDLVQMAIDRQLLRTLGASSSASLLDMGYAFTEQGRKFTMDAFDQSRYAGPAPVTLEAFARQVNRQKMTDELVTFDRIRSAFGDMVFPDSIIEQSGPALTSGRAMLLYGPPGNGKTSVALSFAKVFHDVIYVPYAFMVEGQIIRVHDSSLHASLGESLLPPDDSVSFVRGDESDARWVPCRRPFVVTGGELTLEMLDLRYDATAKFYEAPLHVKALGGCFVIDDFGRQLVSPTNLLNRWIMPLESRMDYLKLHTGKSFIMPFEEMVIFSTNLDPEDLMDPAFLRRIPYKIEVGAPSLKRYRQILQQECEASGLTLSDEIFHSIVHKVREERGLELAAYHARFIVDQVVATCRFMGEKPHFEPRFVDYAVDNLRVHRDPSAQKKSAPQHVTPAVSSPASIARL